MTDKVQKIREEVIRLRNLHQMKYQQIDTNDNMCLVECGKRNLCNELLSFIDSLQEEPKVKESTKTQHINETCKDSDDSLTQESVNEELEKAAVEAFKQIVDSDKNNFLEIFKAGAKWQKEQMMAKAIKGGCFSYKNGFVHISCDIDERVTNIKFGDKVKVIVIKED